MWTVEVLLLLSYHRCLMMAIRSARTGRSSEEGLNMGRHKRTPVCYPCSRLAALNGAPRTWRLKKVSRSAPLDGYFGSSMELTSTSIQ